jgi:hypothetical protein
MTNSEPVAPWLDVQHFGTGLNPDVISLDGPTTAEPGSDDRVTVMASRYAVGLSLFHPDDEPYQPERELNAQPVKTCVFVPVSGKNRR